MPSKPRRRSATRPAGPPVLRPAGHATGEPDPAGPATGEGPVLVPTTVPAVPAAPRAPVGPAEGLTGPGPTPDHTLAKPDPHPGSPAGAPHRDTANEAKGRRRVRGPRDQPAAQAVPDPPAADDAADDAAEAGLPDAQPARPRRDRGFRESADDRSLRALVSLRGTQLPTDLAVRAREFANPTPADLAEAEAEVVLVRRHYVPTTPLATGTRRRPDDARTAEPGEASARAGRTRDRRR